MTKQPVIPAEAGIQCVRFRGLSNTEALDPRLRGDDSLESGLSIKQSMCPPHAASPESPQSGTPSIHALTLPGFSSPKGSKRFFISMAPGASDPCARPSSTMNTCGSFTRTPFSR
jgi:hypothetical protein